MGFLIPQQVENLARDAARSAVSVVKDVIEARREELHDNPVYWYAYEKALLAGMTRARRRVAWWHKKRMREAAAAIQADKALAERCPHIEAAILDSGKPSSLV